MTNRPIKPTKILRERETENRETERNREREREREGEKEREKAVGHLCRVHCEWEGERGLWGQSGGEENRQSQCHRKPETLCQNRTQDTRHKNNRSGDG
jgi:hypothetical protein